jgi:hypothetical protein
MYFPIGAGFMLAGGKSGEGRSLGRRFGRLLRLMGVRRERMHVEVSHIGS